MSHTDFDLTAVFRQRGHRLTPQRQIILDALCATGGHVTVAELYERVHAQFPAIDRSTVYRALDFFGELGLVSSAVIGGVTVYEIAPQEGGCDHHHLVCRDCGDVAHVPESAFAALAERLRAEYGFVAELDNLTIHGRCRECAASGEA
jgi:Fe2+ or Zn2+ uptake regulation protein